MPLFHRKTDEERRAEEEQRRQADAARQAQQQSIAALEAGGIPLEAQRRLSDLRQQEARFFTSDLSVNEFLLGREAGLQPLSQVMGSSIYHVGWQGMPGNSLWSWGSQELTVVSSAMNHARALALGRLEQEARLAGADAVVGVHVTRAEYDWGSDLIEFNTVGTAVRINDGSPTKHPSLTNLSGQDFWKLYRAGYWPLGVVAASTVYYVVASWQTMMANNSFWGGMANQELRDFTAGLYSARHIAMRQVQGQARQLGGEGIVGMEIEQEEDEYEVERGENNKRTDMIFTFHAIGTAIAEMSTGARPAPTYSVLNLKG
jgi:uncharacterized protein YbjQ (UPF0145 family)